MNKLTKILSILVSSVVLADTGFDLYQKIKNRRHESRYQKGGEMA